MNNSELYRLLKHSKLAQVATPLNKTLRTSESVPTHQIIYTPRSSAIRSNFGIKTHLPKKIGYSHIVFNDLDNKKNMPDVEKYSGPYYNRLKFQESGVVLKNYFTDSNPLFPSSKTKTTTSGLFGSDTILSALNLTDNATSQDVKRVIRANPELHKNFMQWLLQHNPQALSNGSATVLVKNLKEFLKSTSSESLVKNKIKITDFTRKKGRKSSSSPPNDIQGTGGFSYMQKGRFTNTPNGIKYGSVMSGRLVSDREAAVGGFVAKLNERTTLLQNNYSKNHPGKHQRQFVMPFKVTEAELTSSGAIRVYADGVKVGSWLQRTGSESSSDPTKYEPSNPSFGSSSERNGRDSIALQNLMNLISH